MNELIKPAAAAIGEIAASPVMSAELEGLIASFLAPAHPESNCAAITPQAIAEARRLLPVYAVLCGPADPGLIEVWITKLFDCVANPPAPDGFDRRLGAIYTILGDLPAGVWTMETLQKISRTNRFWPAIADLDAALRPIAGRLRLHQIALERIASGVPWQWPDVHRSVSREQEMAYAEGLARARADSLRKAGLAPTAAIDNVVPLNPRAPLPETFRNGQIADVLRRARERGFTPAYSAADPRRQPPPDEQEGPLHASDGKA